MDYPTTDGLLSYDWSCIQYTPSYGLSCPTNLSLSSTATNTISSFMFPKTDDYSEKTLFTPSWLLFSIAMGK